MSNEYKLSFTAEEIDEKLRQMGSGSGGGLTVIELEGLIENRNMTEGEIAKFEAATETGLPVIVKAGNGAIQYALLCNFVAGMGVVMFSGVFSEGSITTFVFGKQGDTWVVAEETV